MKNENDLLSSLLTSVVYKHIFDDVSHSIDFMFLYCDSARNLFYCSNRLFTLYSTQCIRSHLFSSELKWFLSYMELLEVVEELQPTLKQY